MDRGEDDIELLVHITAAATTAADEDHRQLARAYADFVPSRTTKLREVEDGSVASSVDVVEDSFEGPSKQNGPMQPRSAGCTPAAGGAPRHDEDAKHGSGAAVGLRSRPAPGMDVGEGVESSSYRSVVPGSQAEEHESLIEEVPDSYPNSVRLDPFVSPTRLLEHHLRRIKAASRPPKRALEYEAGQGQADDIPAVSQKTAKTRSQQTPRGPSSSPQNGTPDLSAVEAVDIIASSISPPICGSPVETEHHIKTVSALLPPVTSSQGEGSATEPCESTKNTALPDASLRRHQSDHGAKTTTGPVPPSLARSMSEPSPRVSPEVLESYKKKFSALEVFPPEPPVSVDHLDESALLTPYLRKLAEALPLEQIYRPQFHPSNTSVSADNPGPRPLQRGYWLLDMSTWDESSRWTTWARLHDRISGGAAGWHVWCVRDEPCVRIRTYCWAALAGHVYLLLNEVSGGRVRCIDVAWVGDEGRPRISVPAAMGRCGAR